MYSLVKRIFDVAVSATFLLCFCWLYALIALMVVIDSPEGRAFYAGLRVGKGGKTFRCYKFRTMQPGSARAQDFISSQDDPRLTRFGKFLRRRRIDEFPQFWNVFVGDMSVVGPRPQPVDLVARLAKEVPGFSRRHFVRPGITGPAAIKGRAASVRGNYRRTRNWDLWYIEHSCFALDLRLLGRTVLVVFQGQGI
jgi:lipopolysaccharide/colanic/teichoic acid biosynthesis glycosyltransferase